MVNLYVGITDYDWFRFLSARQDVDEVNFGCRVGAPNFKPLSSGCGGLKTAMHRSRMTIMIACSYVEYFSSTLVTKSAMLALVGFYVPWSEAFDTSRISASPRRLDRSNVDFLHAHHCIKSAFCFIAADSERLA
jgi:hypothetical protein